MNILQKDELVNLVSQKTGKSKDVCSAIIDEYLYQLKRQIQNGYTVDVNFAAVYAKGELFYFCQLKKEQQALSKPIVPRTRLD